MPTVKKIYIVELATDKKLELQYIPTDVSDSATAKLASITVPGRNLDQYQHISAGDEISFQIDINGAHEMNNHTYVLDRVNWLKSLVFHGGKSKPASYVQIIWGDMFRGMSFVVESISAKTSDFRPAIKYNPLQANVDIKLKLVGDNITKDSFRKK